MPDSPELPTGRLAMAGDAAHEEWQGPDRRRGGHKVLRIAAVGDLHCGVSDIGSYREMFAEANSRADVLILTGDMTHRGEIAEFKVVADELIDVKVPIVAVLGNHDYESNRATEGSAELRSRGIHLLDGDSFQLSDQVGFAGVKGFMGGFGRGTLTLFGEPEAKAFVNATLVQVQALELALRRLATPIRIAIMHYAPIVATVVGEPEIIYPYLGTDRLAEALDRYGCTVAFHGHAHSGTFSGHTIGGVPVFNVSLPLLRKDGGKKPFFLYELPIQPAAAEPLRAGESPSVPSHSGFPGAPDGATS